LKVSISPHLFDIDWKSFSKKSENHNKILIVFIIKSVVGLLAFLGLFILLLFLQKTYENWLICSIFLAFIQSFYVLIAIPLKMGFFLDKIAIISKSRKSSLFIQYCFIWTILLICFLLMGIQISFIKEFGLLLTNSMIFFIIFNISLIILEIIGLFNKKIPKRPEILMFSCIFLLNSSVFMISTIPLAIFLSFFTVILIYFIEKA